VLGVLLVLEPPALEPPLALPPVPVLPVLPEPPVALPPVLLVPPALLLPPALVLALPPCDEELPPDAVVPAVDPVPPESSMTTPGAFPAEQPTSHASASKPETVGASEGRDMCSPKCRWRTDDPVYECGQ
jgi:hypothetical protein